MKKFLTYTLLGVLLAGCAGGGREPLETVVDKALAGAERQTLLMAEKYRAREGRLPRTWENGEDVSSDSRWWWSKCIFRALAFRELLESFCWF